MAQHFQDKYWLREHKNLGDYGGRVICKLQHRHGDIVTYQHQLKKTNSRKSVSTLVRVAPVIIAGILIGE